MGLRWKSHLLALGGHKRLPKLIGMWIAMCGDNWSYVCVWLLDSCLIKGWGRLLAARESAASRLGILVAAAGNQQRATILCPLAPSWSAKASKWVQLVRWDCTWPVPWKSKMLHNLAQGSNSILKTKAADVAPLGWPKNAGNAHCINLFIVKWHSAHRRCCRPVGCGHR